MGILGEILNTTLAFGLSEISGKIFSAKNNHVFAQNSIINNQLLLALQGQHMNANHMGTLPKGQDCCDYGPHLCLSRRCGSG